MHRAADRAPLLVRKVHDAEREFARTKNVRDLTGVIRYSAEAKKIIGNMKAATPERKGIPIGQRWN